MEVWISNIGFILASKLMSVTYVGLFSSLVSMVESQALYKLDLNDKAGEGIYVASLQVKQSKFQSH